MTCRLSLKHVKNYFGLKFLGFKEIWQNARINSAIFKALGEYSISLNMLIEIWIFAESDEACIIILVFWGRPHMHPSQFVKAEIWRRWQWGFWFYIDLFKLCWISRWSFPSWLDYFQVSQLNRQPCIKHVILFEIKRHFKKCNKVLQPWHAISRTVEL